MPAMRIRFLSLALTGLLGLPTLGLVGCSSDPESQELGMSPEPGKDDGAGVLGLAVNGDYADTQVWKVTNQWEDRTTPAARAAGIAWPENSGLSWDEKFAQWVGSFEHIAGEGMYAGDTINITSPYDKSMPGPRLDCADLAIMLRVSFAAWYGLPFYMVAGSNPVVYFGHFGVRTAQGRWNQAPRFADYADNAKLTASQLAASWPHDAGLRSQHVSEDAVGFLDGGKGGMGAWLDEMHPNKRVGRLITFMQNYLGSMNMVDPNNTFNLVPEALRTGDTLLFRRGTRGTGHTMVVVSTVKNPDGTIEAQDVYGNEPPAQPFFDSTQSTKGNFTDDEGGGPSMNSDGEVYVKLGGGLKRWRVAKVKGDRYINTWMNGDEASWVDSSDYARLSARPKQFDKLLGEAPYEKKLAGLLEQIDDKRNHLRQFPASCAARERREALFADLTYLMYDHAQWSTAQVEAKYRVLEDYIYPALDYSKSKTCCWNSSTTAMADIIVAYNKEQQKNQCVAPTPFVRNAGVYQPFADYAQRIGRGAEWRAWSKDEDCTATSDSDTLLENKHPETSYCDLASIDPPPPPQLDGGAPGNAGTGGEPGGDVDGGVQP